MSSAENKDIFQKVHHIAIIVSDYERSKAFYTQVLGFKILNEVHRPERNSYKLDLEVGSVYQIELFSFPSPPKRATNPEAAGLRHLAFEVKNITEAIDYLRSKDVEVENPRIDPETGKKFAFFFDPDNLPLEIYEI